MKPIITTGCSNSRQPQREAQFQQAVCQHPWNAPALRAPTTICSFSTNRVQLVMKPKGEDKPSEVEGAKDAQTGESSSDVCNMFYADGKTGDSGGGSSSWLGSQPDSPLSTGIASKPPPAARTGVIVPPNPSQTETSVPLVVNLKPRKASMKPQLKGDARRGRKAPLAAAKDLVASKDADLQPQIAKRRAASKETGYYPHLESHDQLQAEMDGMEAANQELQQSASLARSELEALQAQVHDLQGSLRSGESENDRLQAELRCLRQSLQLDVAGPRTDQGSGDCILDDIFADFDYGEGSTEQDCMDFTDLAHEFLLRSS